MKNFRAEAIIEGVVVVIEASEVINQEVGKIIKIVNKNFKF